MNDKNDSAVLEAIISLGYSDYGHSVAAVHEKHNEQGGSLTLKAVKLCLLRLGAFGKVGVVRDEDDLRTNFYVRA